MGTPKNETAAACLFKLLEFPVEASSGEEDLFDASNACLDGSEG